MTIYVITFDDGEYEAGTMNEAIGITRDLIEAGKEFSVKIVED